MSLYKGQWPEQMPFNEADIKVTVDGQPLPPAKSEVPAAGLSFGWGNFSPWSAKKLLSYSLLRYELHDVMGFPTPIAHRYLIDVGDSFLDEKIARLGKQWSMTSDEIGQWIKERYPKTWEELTSHHAPA